MMNTYIAKAWSHSAILEIGRCLDLDPVVSSKFGTRLPISINAPASIFCTRFGGTGRTDGPGVCAEVSALPEAVVWFGRSRLTWSRSRPEEVEGRGLLIRHVTIIYMGG